jgi:hypothetical protein
MSTSKTELLFRGISQLTIPEIEKICTDCSELPDPPQAFLVSASSSRNSLLAVGTEFLNEGEGLQWPGLPLLGATFDLDWGYAFIDLKNRSDGSLEFQQPSGRFEDFAVGDTCGYRLYPLDNQEIPTLLCELSKIRNELSERRTRAAEHVPNEFAVLTFNV